MVMSEWDQLKLHLQEWVEEYRGTSAAGKVAEYIPELSKAEQDRLGIHLLDSRGHSISSGDAQAGFTMQSISKVFTLILALMDHGEAAVFSKVGMEPTGDHFNSIMKLELSQPAIPFNPLINAGAIVVSSMIKGENAKEKSARILSFFRELAGNPGLDYDEPVYRSESETGHLNRSMAYFCWIKEPWAAAWKKCWTSTSANARSKSAARTWLGWRWCWHSTEPIPCRARR